MATTSSCQLKCRKAVGILILLMCCTSHYADARIALQFALPAQEEEVEESASSVVGLESHKAFESLLTLDQQQAGSRRLSFLVPTPSMILPYHNGVILSGAPEIAVYVIWYGSFSTAQKAPIVDFLSSFSAAPTVAPSVASWWKITAGYKDSAGLAVAPMVKLAGQQELRDYAKGKVLKNADIQSLVLSSLAAFPVNSNAMYVVLTADDVVVEDFCRNECGSHLFTSPAKATNQQQLPFAWVGNSASQCPGMCAWPYAKPQYGPPGEPLLPPSGDVGIDGMIINLGTILAGCATNPFNNGFYQGDASAPVEAATACAGTYGVGAYSGYPGQLLLDSTTGASYNVLGANGRQFLMPALWDPVTLACVAP
ncbi:hypothetical protein Mapa_014119 [Marchantia paleacea]|nr:hypothetical protein Mapa_014119 [Marchantia paleacea]